MILKRVGPLSTAKVMGALYACIGLIAGAFLSLFAMLGTMISHEMARSAPFAGALFGIGAIIVLPIFYGVLGFVVGLVSAAIYNVLAGVIGGIEVELQ